MTSPVAKKRHNSHLVDLMKSGNTIITRSRAKAIYSVMQRRSGKKCTLDELHLLRQKMRKGKKSKKKGKENAKVNESLKNNQDTSYKLHYENVVIILERKYIDVVDRLKLNFTPKCALDETFCTTHHYKECPKPHTAGRLRSFKGKNLLCHNRPINFIKHIQDLCIKEEFPGEDILLQIFQLVLTINPNKDAAYDAEFIINQCEVIYHQIIFDFPPCWYYPRDAYKKLLENSVELKLFGVESNSKQTLFEFTISKLVEILSEPESSNNLQADSNSFRSNSINFSEWEEDHSFGALNRCEKIKRLFRVLHFITKLLEYDLAIWILRNPSKYYKRILSSDRPLIAGIFQFNIYNQITQLVKQTLHLFIMCCCFELPQDDIDVISRLFSLVSIAINLCDENVYTKIQYPNIGPKTLNFVKEVFKLIDNQFGRSVSNYLAVIKWVKIPFIKYLLINDLLRKINSDSQEMSVQRIALDFKKKRWLNCQEVQTQPSAIREAPDSQYPVIPKRTYKNAKQSVITRKEYLNLLLDALKAYCDTFDLKKILKIFTEENEKTSRATETPCTGNLPEETNELEILEKKIKSLEKKINMNEKRVISEEKEQLLNLMHFDGQCMGKFRNDIKYLLILRKHITDLKDNYEDDFEEWYKFMSTM